MACTDASNLLASLMPPNARALAFCFGSVVVGFLRFLVPLAFEHHIVNS